MQVEQEDPIVPRRAVRSRNVPKKGAAAASREERQRAMARDIANQIRQWLRWTLWTLVNLILQRTRWADYANAAENDTGAPRWYISLLRIWKERYAMHWERWRAVILFLAFLCAALVAWSGLYRLILRGYINKSVHAPVVTHARAIADPQAFVDGYMTYVPFGALLDAYAVMSTDGILQRIRDIADKHVAALEGGASASDTRDVDGNDIDDDLEMQALRRALDRVGADMAQYADAPPEIAMRMGAVCGHVTQLEDGQFHVRRLCWDLLNVMLDTTYYPQGIVNRIMSATYRNNPSLDAVRKDRLEWVRRDKALPNVRSNMLQGMPPCVCLHHLGFVESGAYTVMPDGRSKLFLDPRLSALTSEEKAHNRKHAFVTEMRPPHEEIETTDRAFWSILGESPRLQQNAWLKVDYWTVPDDAALECYYGNDLGAPEKALLFAEAHVTQEMRNYERPVTNDTAREAKTFEYVNFINGFAHAYKQQDRASMLAYSYERAVELRLNVKFIQEAHAREERARATAAPNAAAAATPTSWFEKALRTAGVPLGGFGRGASDGYPQCSAEARREMPHLTRVEGERVEAPQSQCLLHCIHLHNTHERARARVFKDALEQHKQHQEQRYRSDRAHVITDNVAAERPSEDDVDDYARDLF